MQISVSILGAQNKIDAVNKINKLDIDYLHLDIMDNHFVENKSLPFNEIKKIVSHSNKKLDVHLMVENPSKYILDYSLLNTEYITIHCEIKNVLKYLKQIEEIGIKKGISINPNTNIKEVLPYLDKVDKILIMSVNPGLPGQTFIESTLDKIKETKEYINKFHLHTKIAVDGGINESNAFDIINSGADILSVGNFITNSDNYEEQIEKIKRVY